MLMHPTLDHTQKRYYHTQMKKRSKSTRSALFAKVRQRVLEILYVKPEQLFYTNEIIRLSHSGTGAVQRELSALLKADLIITQSFGNQKRYQANTASPLFHDLRNIILKTTGFAGVMQEALTSVSNEIQFAFIYGSIASGKDTATSDIDLMIISDTLTYADIFALLETPGKKLGRAINPTFYAKTDWIKKRKNKNHFVMQIIQQPKIFLIGNEDAFKKF